MKRLLRLIAVSLTLILFSVSPAQALFGSECKKPKSTYSQYLNEYRRQLSAEKTAESRFLSNRDRDFKQCLSNPKVFFESRGSNRGQDAVGCDVWRVFDAKRPTIVGRSAVKAYKDAMLIVTSYKKCFDPSVYIEAVKWLKANPK